MGSVLGSTWLSWIVLALALGACASAGSGAGSGALPDAKTVAALELVDAGGPPR